METNTLNKVAKVLSKVLEILFWIAEGTMILALIISLVAGEKLMDYVSQGLDSGTLTVSGFDIQILDENSSLIVGALTLACIAGIVAYGLIAMIFRNIYLIFKKSETESPFAKDNIRMVREIGIFAIALPITDVILSIAGRFLIHGDLEISVSLNSIVFGIIILCLSRFFAYGAKLERDVDGLL